MVKLEIIVLGFENVNRFEVVRVAMTRGFEPLIRECELRAVTLDKNLRDKYDIIGSSRMYSVCDLALLYCIEELKQESKNYALGISNFSVWDSHPPNPFKTRVASCIVDSRVAQVTTNSTITSIESSHYPEPLVIESLHEVGHLLGLGHHEKKKAFNAEGKLCPMTTAHYSSATMQDYVLQRGRSLCKICQKKLLTT